MKTGSGWGAAYHTDLYHQGGTSIGVNVEVTKKVGDGRAIGVNIQSKGLATDEAINIQTAPVDASNPNAPASPTGAWQTGLHFDKTSRGSRAIWVEGAWDTGIDLGANSLAMASGTRIYLEDSHQVYITFNKDTNQVEFHNGDAVIGYLALDQNPHQL